MKAAAAPVRKGVASLRVRLAAPEDDPTLRSLLREGDMAGAIRLGMEREPSFFGSLDREAERHDTVVLEDGDGIVAMGSRLVHRVVVGGEPVRMGYLGQLRVARGRRVGRRSLTEGWGLLLDRRRTGELPFDLTGIAADNGAARRLLERGLPGAPRYHPVTEYEVLAVPTGARGRRVREEEVVEAGPGEWEEVERLRREVDRGAALSLRWRGPPVQPPASGSPPDGGAQPVLRLAALADGVVAAGLAVVDPSPWRQYVIHGYGGALAWMRPVVNLVTPFSRMPRLPAPGERLRSGFLVGPVCRQGKEALIPVLLRQAAAWARRQGIATLLYGGPASDRWAKILEATHRPRRYRTVLYLVSPEEDPGPTLRDLRRGPFHIDPMAL